MSALTIFMSANDFFTGIHAVFYTTIIIKKQLTPHTYVEQILQVL